MVVKGSYDWYSRRDGIIREHAVQGGVDIDGSPLYVGRATHAEWFFSGRVHTLPAKVSPRLRGALVSYNGTEYKKSEYQVLCSTGVEWKWVPASDGNVPDAALKVGEMDYREVLYMGRVPKDGSTTLGKRTMLTCPEVTSVASTQLRRKRRFSRKEVAVGDWAAAKPLMQELVT